MKKLEMDLELVLPPGAGRDDPCRARLMELLSGRRGVFEAHLEDGGGPASRLCIHFDPDILPLRRLEDLVREAGATLAERYGHLDTALGGLRHERHARLVESALMKLPGVLHASVGLGNGRVQVELDLAVTSEEAVLEALADMGVGAAREARSRAPETAATEQPHDHSGERRELAFSLVCGGLTALGWVLSRGTETEAWALPAFVAAYGFGGWFTLAEVALALRARRFEIDFLMLLAAVGAAALGEWFEGALLLFLFTFGHALEGYAMRRAREAIESLAALAPKTAVRIRGDGSDEEVPLDALQPGDRLRLNPSARIPADGVVVEGTGSVDQSPITGESVPADKRPTLDAAGVLDGRVEPTAEERVFAGTINGATALVAVVTRAASDSTLARVVQMVCDAESQKSPTQRFTDRFEQVFVPVILALVAALLGAWLVVDEPFSASFYRAMAVLVAASPCALANATPSTVLSGVARAARGGVLVRGGAHLEMLGLVRVMAFDKTGTLTSGKPQLVDVVALRGTERVLLSSVAAVERRSDHPLARAIVAGARSRDVDDQHLPAALDVEALVGFGVRASVNGRRIVAGKPDLFRRDDGALPEEARVAVDRLENGGRTVVVVTRDDEFIGVLGLTDTPRDEARGVLSELQALGVSRTVMLSGDNQRAADAIAREVGITEARGNLLPEQKVTVVAELARTTGGVAMVGDGVNDAPAMAHASVGVAMGAMGSDVALETADVALMADDLRGLPFAVGLSRAARRIIRQNLWLSLGMVAILVPATLFGFAGIGEAVALHEGSTLVVVANALRLLAYRRRGTPAVMLLVVSVVLALTSCRARTGELHELDLVAAPASLAVAGDTPLTVWAYNGQVPGPTLRIRLGDRLRVRFTNRLPQPTTIHWHGVRVPNAMDGVPWVTQPPVEPGQSFVYEFTPPEAGTFWFHPHVRSSEQVERGLYGALIVEDREPSAYSRDELWVLDDILLGSDGQIAPAFNTRRDLAHDGRWGNTITVNGKRDTVLAVQPGERIRLRLLNVANGRVFAPDFSPLEAKVVAVDGLYTEQPLDAAGFEIAPGNRIDLDVSVPPSMAGQRVVVTDRFTRRPFAIGEIAIGPGPPVETPQVASRARDELVDAVFDAAEPIRIDLRLNARAGGPLGIEWMINDVAMTHAEHASHAATYALPLGEQSRVRFTNESYRLHPMHLHGMFFRVLARNGKPAREPFTRDTVLVHPQETIDVVVLPRDPGSWMAHCHVLEHAEAGMMTLIEVR